MLVYVRLVILTYSNTSTRQSITNSKHSFERLLSEVLMKIKMTIFKFDIIQSTHLVLLAQQYN